MALGSFQHPAWRGPWAGWSLHQPQQGWCTSHPCTGMTELDGCSPCPTSDRPEQWWAGPPELSLSLCWSSLRYGPLSALELLERLGHLTHPLYPPTLPNGIGEFIPPTDKLAPERDGSRCTSVHSLVLQTILGGLLCTSHGIKPWLPTAAILMTLPPFFSLSLLPCLTYPAHSCFSASPPQKPPAPKSLSWAVLLGTFQMARDPRFPFSWKVTHNLWRELLRVVKVWHS